MIIPERAFSVIGKKAKGKAKGVGTSAMTILVKPTTTFLPGTNFTLLV